MPINHKSGRLVVEVPPALKLKLHAVLAAEGMSLKDWIVGRAQEYVSQRAHLGLSESLPDGPGCQLEGRETRRETITVDSTPSRHLAHQDWTFEKANTREATHAAHPYPAKFIPQIPRALIEALHPGDDSAVLDPFCGSGTTLVEAATADIPAVGIDLHPLACLISKVKVTPLSCSLEEAARAALARGSTRPVPEIPRLDHWFTVPVQQVLADLVASIEQETQPDTRDALRVAFSSIVVRVSRQESDTRYAAVENNIEPQDVKDLFLRAARTIGNAVSNTWDDAPRPRVRIVNKNILHVTPEEVGAKVSLVVTSPPYPNAYEYWLYHKYRMYWLGMDPLHVRKNEIGSRCHFFKKNPASADDFRVQMTEVFRLLHKVLVVGGHACFQVGNSKIRGRLVDNGELLRLAAEPFGFRNVETVSREIPLTRKAFNPSHARIREERILVFRRMA